MYKVHANIFGRPAVQCSCGNLNFNFLSQYTCTIKSTDARSTYNSTRSLATQNHTNQLPTESHVVICGGGLIGAAVAYHLGLCGLGAETILFEQDKYVPKNKNR